MGANSIAETSNFILRDSHAQGEQRIICHGKIVIGECQLLVRPMGWNHVKIAGAEITHREEWRKTYKGISRS